MSNRMKAIELALIAVAMAAVIGGTVINARSQRATHDAEINRLAMQCADLGYTAAEVGWSKERMRQEVQKALTIVDK